MTKTISAHDKFPPKSPAPSCHAGQTRRTPAKAGAPLVLGKGF